VRHEPLGRQAAAPLAGIVLGRGTTHTAKRHHGHLVQGQKRQAIRATGSRRTPKPSAPP
jgi:hypothetical protein